MILFFCGLSGAGKTTLAESIKAELIKYGMQLEIIDADEYRTRLFTDLKFTKEDRLENMRRLGFIAEKFATHGILTIVSAINPYEEMRIELKNSLSNAKIVHIDCPLAQLKIRDTKGLYARAALPHGNPDKLLNLSGVNDPFEIPQFPDVYVNTGCSSLNDCSREIFTYIINQFSNASKRTA
ncbi:adenylyl-sulfate kinase [Pedobacter sp. AW31-3R]|uniref:adenylyl-sulfate kinase n=1 Tax=Pedobacter sp. AW31-3R TaxID=3445781 RepID=UPI003F9F2ACA